MVLNHAGVCLSYDAIWGYLRQLASDARFLDVVKTGRWMWVYDNLNFHQPVRHEREGRKVLLRLKNKTQR